MTSSARSSPLALTVLALLHSGPLHPYGVQRLIRQWGKDQVVNVNQRASLYRTIDRLLAEGLIAVHGTGRDQAYPERTAYEITDAGRRTGRNWLEQMLSVPKQEFPQFPAALSYLQMISTEEATRFLQRRADRLEVIREELRSQLSHRPDGLSRISYLETEYLLAVVEAEDRWVRSVTDDLRTGRLTWPDEQDRPEAGDRGGSGAGV